MDTKIVNGRADTPFRHYSLKHRAIAWVSARLFSRVTYTQRHGLLSGMRRRGGLGWLPFAPAETPEHRFWMNLDLGDDAVVYDIGAFHGLLTLYFSRKARQVVAYEPNSRNRKILDINTTLNSLGNVRVRALGLGSQRQNLQMVYDPLMPGGATLDHLAAQRLLADKHSVSQTVQISTLDDEMADHSLPVPTFIKIDVEGYELEVLRGARRTLLAHRPALFLEMHGATIAEKRANVRAIVESLNALGYAEILHVESGTPVTAANSSLALQGHLFCPGGPK